MRLLIVLFLFIFQNAYAGLTGETKITGRVLKYNKKTVTLALYGDQKVTVPRSSIRKSFKKQKLKTGRFVTAVFSAEEIMDKIKEQSKKK